MQRKPKEARRVIDAVIATAKDSYHGIGTPERTAGHKNRGWRFVYF
jgi:hypothetical protein